MTEDDAHVLAFFEVMTKKYSRYVQPVENPVLLLLRKPNDLQKHYHIQIWYQEPSTITTYGHDLHSARLIDVDLHDPDSADKVFRIIDDWIAWTP
jgi:hypothetical protein